MGFRVWRIVGILGAVLYFVVLCSIGFFAVFRLYGYRQHNIGNQVSQSHYLGMMLASNEIPRGFTTNFEGIEDDEYDHYGNLEIISLFGSQEFSCWGSCSCIGNELRRSANIMRKGIIHVITAVTSVVAYTKTQEYFKEECVTILESSCPSNSIQSKVESCEPINTKTNRMKEHSSNEKEKDSRTYRCTGHCLSKVFFREETRKIAKEFGCESLVTEGDVTLPFPKRSQRSLYPKAVMKFQKEHLVPFCGENSRTKYVYFLSQREGRRIKSIKACVASRKGIFRNPSIKCRQIHPDYQWRQSWRSPMEEWAKKVFPEGND